MSVQPIIEFFNKLSPIDQSGWEEFSKIATVRTMKKNEFFFTPGQEPLEYGAILKGVFRHYHLDKDGKEWVKSFAGASGLIGPHAEYLMRMPTRTYLQALTDAEIVVVPYEAFQKLIGNSLQWQTLYRKITELMFLAKENREYQFLLKDAEERYKIFLEEHKAISNFISDYQIAAYIGITPQALSRIRSKLVIS